MKYDDALRFIRKTGFMGSVLGLERVKCLLRYLGDPQEKLHFVHITGTNGKGSVSAYLGSILTASGLKTGRFNSPYIQRFSEQIRIDNDEISKDGLCGAVEIVKSAYDRMLLDGHESTTEFETLFAAALVYFLSEQCDIVILEVGMGGKGDATNVIPSPEAAVITNISMDHAAFLGSDLPSIAAVKSGIIKPGCDVVCAGQPDEVMGVIRQACERSHAPLHVVKDEDIRLLSCSLDGQDFTIPFIAADTAPGSALSLHTSLAGTYQPKNAALAVLAALVLKKRGFKNITVQSIANGVSMARWPGRFEVLRKAPAFVIDGAHNPDGIRALSESLKQYFPGKKLIMIIGVLADKDYRAMLTQILPFAGKFHTVTVPNPRSLPGEELAAVLNSMGADAVFHDSIADAVNAALGEAGREDAILAFGSLYYIGYVRSYVLRDI